MLHPPRSTYSQEHTKTLHNSATALLCRGSSVLAAVRLRYPGATSPHHQYQPSPGISTSFFLPLTIAPQHIRSQTTQHPHRKSERQQGGCMVVSTTLPTCLTMWLLRLRRSAPDETTWAQKVSAVTMSLAILEDGQGNVNPPPLLVLGGDVNIRDGEHNLLLDAMNRKSRPSGSVCWSKSIPPPAKFAHKHSCSTIQAPPATEGQQQLCGIALPLLFAQLLI